MTREAGTQAHKAVCAEDMSNGHMGPVAESLLSTSLVLPCTGLFPHLISSSLLSAPRHKALLPPYTDEDLEAQRQGVTSPVSSLTKRLNLD